jgi:cellulose biosynthesis protein BcsQ
MTFAAIDHFEFTRSKEMPDYPRLFTGPAPVIAVSARKGGAGPGKTTLSANIAAYYAAKGAKTLYLEVDDNSQAFNVLVGKVKRGDPALALERTTYTLFYPDKFDIDAATFRLPISDFLARSSINKEPLQRIIDERGWKTTGALDMIPGTPSLRLIDTEYTRAQIEANLSGDSFEPNFQFMRGLERLRQQYDIIVCDTPPSLTTVLTNVLVACSFVVVPVELFPSSIYSFDEVMQTITSVKSVQRRKQLPELKMLGVVAGRKEAIPEHDEILLEYTAPHQDPDSKAMVPPLIQYPMLGVIPLDSAAVSISEKKRTPMILQAPNKEVGRALLQTAINITKEAGLPL